MKNVKIKKGYRLNILGQPSLDLKSVPEPDRVAACPARIPFIKPRLRVKKGDAVQLGDLLYEDKRDSRLRFLSPAGGQVTDIRFGLRRSIEEIVILRDDNEKAVSFEVLDVHQIAQIERGQLCDHLLSAGLWPMLRALPYRDIADPDTVPPKIFVHLDNLEPFHPDPRIYLKGRQPLFALGMAALRRLSDQVVVSAHRGLSNEIDLGGEPLDLSYEGVYPASDPGTLLYHTKSEARENRSWYINGADLLLIGSLLAEGKYPTHRIVAVGGSGSQAPGHYQTRIGAPLRSLVPHPVDTLATRIIAGGLLRGHPLKLDGYLGWFETALTLLPRGEESEFMALFNPGFKKPSYSRAYLSALNRSAMEYNCNRHGGDRACIACMHCADICPVDILPQLVHKAVLAGEVEEALAHGLLDCVECGLCAYACPSKIELLTALRSAKADYLKEQGGR